jgi:hypothetical protein
MTHGQRFMLMMGLVLVALLGLSMCGYKYWETELQTENPLGWLASSETRTVELPLCMDAQTREEIRTVMLAALDTALSNHFERLFEVWLRDERGQPGRARTGVEQGIKAYLGARKNTIDWNPPVCAG